MYTAIKIVNQQAEDIKELYREPVQMMNKPKLVTMIPDAANFYVYDNKIFLVKSPEGFIIDIFDCHGSPLDQIKKKRERMKVTKVDKEQAMAYVRESFRQKKITVFVPIQIVENGWESFTKWANFHYPSHLPLFQNILVKEDRIYLQTCKKKENKEEYLILDLKGNLKKSILLPQIMSAALWDVQMLGIGTKLYDVERDHFIYIDENEDEESWEVFSIPIKFK